VIAGGSVTLRPWQPSDASFVYFSCQDAELRRWIRLPSPYRAGHAAAFVTDHACRQPEESGAFFAITRTDTGELLGSISLTAIDGDHKRASAECWIAADAREQGFAAAALDALAEWGFDHLGLARIGITVDADNEAARRAAARAGFVPAGATDGSPLCFRRDAAR
jgi:RimJ/RimL family protein N-acetyltransferase